MTIQEVSDRVGITQAGLLKYVKNKNGLLMLVLRRYEDSSEAGDYIQSKLALTPEQRELSLSDARVLPDHRRGHHETPATHTAVSGAACRSHRPNHPAHEYYAQRGGRLRAQIGSYPWKLPPEYNTPQKIGLLSMCVGSAMEACNPAGLASQTSTSCPAGPSTRTSCSLAPTGTATAEPAFHSGYSPIVSTAATICVTVPVFRTSSKDFFTNGCG